MIKNPKVLLDKLEKHNLHLHPLFEDDRSEVYKNADSATYFLMKDREFVWVGRLNDLELWVNANY